MVNILKSLIDADYRHFQRVLRLAKAADALAITMKEKTNEELKAVHNRLRRNLNKLKDSDIIEAVALIREVNYRILGQYPYFVQLLGGIVLYYNDIAEMKTGEGKTLTSTIPVYLKALEGKYVHVVTTNEYLSERDYTTLKPVYEFFGITCGLNRRSLNRLMKQHVYKNQIVYTTNSELGFDYLRDSFVMSNYEKVVCKLDYALVDEVDSVLIDEARTPLIISSPKNDDLNEYGRCQSFVRSLSNSDIICNEESRSVYLSESGVQKAHDYFNKKDLYNPNNMTLIHKINQALKANYIFKRDIDYVVMNNEVLIVDEYTGRILPGREYSEGLHQAIQAKEDVPIKAESVTEATITYQNLFRLYNELAGMSGTTKSEEIELFTTYNLRSFEIPTNKPIIRIDDQDAIFETIKDKKDAIVSDAIRLSHNGNPVLIGTASIEDSIMLSREFTKLKVNHIVLNGTQDENEADIVSKAGTSGRITIATNIAGRGTDIPLDSKSKEKGGLCILGFQRHDSRRIDNQLKGRSGRQGDPGYTKMYVSLEDVLITKYANDEQKQKLSNKALNPKKRNALINLIQKQAESNNYNVRKKLLEYDNELSLHRKIIFELRDSLLDITNLRSEITYAIRLYLENKLNVIRNEDMFYQWQNTIKREYRLPKDVLDIENREKYLTMVEQKVIRDINMNICYSWDIIQRMMLQYLNYVWKNHVDNMVEFKKGIELRSTGGIKPLDAYKEESYKLFRKMWNDYYEFVGNIIFVDETRN
ncbi:MAG: preprotein translocase subunit SecA [Erysipelotrichales bacterium]|nr:preprotein translocase subunit SecA [Erysipelotrichales bacterium]